MIRPSKKCLVGVAQLVEHPVVVRVVAGSTPVAHPKSSLDNLKWFFIGVPVALDSDNPKEFEALLFFQAA